MADEPKLDPKRLRSRFFWESGDVQVVPSDPEAAREQREVQKNQYRQAMERLKARIEKARKQRDGGA